MYIIVMSAFNSCDCMFLLCFQCGEWIRVRVHQMEPDLMEVGSTVEEALQLQAEHDQLLSKLQVSNTPPLLGHFFFNSCLYTSTLLSLPINTYSNKKL